MTADKSESAPLTEAELAHIKEICEGYVKWWTCNPQPPDYVRLLNNWMLQGIATITAVSKERDEAVAKCGVLVDCAEEIATRATVLMAFLTVTPSGDIKKLCGGLQREIERYETTVDNLPAAASAERERVKALEVQAKILPAVQAACAHFEARAQALEAEMIAVTKRVGELTGRTVSDE